MWQKMYPTKEERTRSTIMENNYVCSMPQIFKKGDYYYMIGQAVSYGHSVYLYRGETPYGPFTDQKILFNVPYAVDKIGNQYYKNLLRVNLHLELCLLYTSPSPRDA